MIRPDPNRVVMWSLELWRRVLLGLERVNEEITEVASPSPARPRRAGKPPQIW